MRRRGWELSVAAMVALMGCEATEPPPAAATITVSATDTELDVGETVQATVVVLSSSGSQLDTRSVTWSTSDALVARVSPAGAVVAEGGGSATITAVSGGISGSLVVRVVDRAHSLAFASTTPTAMSGDTTAVRVVVRDSALQAMPSRPVRWTSRNEGVATVSSNGIVQGGAKGRTWVVARSGKVSDSVEMVVMPVRAGPNRQLAFRHYSSSGREEVWVWAGPGTFGTERASIPGRSVRSYRWSFDGQWLMISYRPTPQLPALVELSEIDRGTHLSYAVEGVQDADLSPDSEGRLVMSVASAGRQAIVLLRPDGGDAAGPRQLTHGPESAMSPMWAPDGRQIAFLQGPDANSPIGELWLMAADGSSPMRVAPRARNVAWSPDAKQLAFDDGDRVWLVARDGTGLRAISPAAVPSLATENGRPRWSSDARRLVHSYSGEVRVLMSNGTLLSTIREDPSVKHADFSPDGQLLAYATSNGLRITTPIPSALRITVPVNNVEPFPLWRP